MVLQYLAQQQPNKRWRVLIWFVLFSSVMNDFQLVATALQIIVYGLMNSMTMQNTSGYQWKLCPKITIRKKKFRYRRIKQIASLNNLPRIYIDSQSEKWFLFAKINILARGLCTYRMASILSKSKLWTNANEHSIERRKKHIFIRNQHRFSQWWLDRWLKRKRKINANKIACQCCYVTQSYFTMRLKLFASVSMSFAFLNNSTVIYAIDFSFYSMLIRCFCRYSFSTHCLLD